MALNIKSAEAHALARKLAEATGESMTEAVTRALREALHRAEHRETPLLERLETIAEHCASLSVLDERSPEDILGYGERGMPG